MYFDFFYEVPEGVVPSHVSIFFCSKGIPSLPATSVVGFFFFLFLFFPSRSGRAGTGETTFLDCHVGLLSVGRSFGLIGLRCFFILFFNVAIVTCKEEKDLLYFNVLVLNGCPVEHIRKNPCCRMFDEHRHIHFKSLKFHVELTEENMLDGFKLLWCRCG